MVDNIEVRKSTQLFFKFGKLIYPVASIKDASEKWCKVRDIAMADGLGVSDMKSQPFILNEKREVIAHISWNGRVWKGSDYKSNNKVEILI